MDDFRIGSISPADKYRDQEPPDSSKRKKSKRPEGPASEQDDVVDLTESSEPAAEPVEDYYAPTPETEENQ